LKAEDAADVAQDVFSAAAMNLSTFHHDRPGDSFRGWLWTITQNKIHDRLRRQKGLPEAQGGTDAQMRLAQVPEPPPDPSTSGVANGRACALDQRVVELVRAGVEERTWEAFWQVVVEGRAAAEVAEELGISVQAVHNAKYRIRRRLQQEVDGLPE
jgi:RNA polymerase sigma-70 factor (ECF subfamily)